ncbi:MAG: hypothetical protein WKF84_18270 [Pyrinomonadaceae bacterium]
MDASRAVQAIDANVVDRAVNGAGLRRQSIEPRRRSWVDSPCDRRSCQRAPQVLCEILISPMLRRAQTGLVPNYALVMVIGLVAAQWSLLRRGHFRNREAALRELEYFL